ncbi:glycosyltransferase [Arcticibacter tournemirensis]
MNFVFVSLQQINTDRESTSTSLAKELSKNHRVLYVNPPIDRKTLLLKRKDKFIRERIDAIKRKEKALIQETENLWILNPVNIIESINWLPFTFLFRIFNRLNNKRLASEIKESLRILQFDSFIVVNDKDMFRSFYLKELLKPSLYIYLDRDYTLGFDYWKKHGKILEPELIKKADVVVCNSLDFTKNAKRYNKNSYYIGNGADLDNFNPEKVWPKPDELQMLERPLIGYVGALNSQRLDILLLEELASSLKKGTLVLIGPEDDLFKQSKLHQLPNICFIEKKHMHIVPAYVKHFDVCINPQAVNEITIGNFPLKIVEYLAMGRPVVATSTNTMQEVFSSYCYLAKTPREFTERIEKALEEDNPELSQSRMKYAGNFSWENVAGNLLHCINEISTKKRSFDRFY